ncbi:MAG TPA: hypothetical protein VNJ08_01425 [Bacteriovoracaceae bacterium]|nr:hypothetical protein [Bacteriovoracaceae bacterium]
MKIFFIISMLLLLLPAWGHDHFIGFGHDEGKKAMPSGVAGWLKNEKSNPVAVKFENDQTKQASESATEPECDADGIADNDKVTDSLVLFKKFEPACFALRPPEIRIWNKNKHNKVSRLEADQKACHCMSQTGTSKLDDPEMKSDESRETIQNLRANVKAKKEKIKSLSEGMVLQSMLITKTKELGLELMSKYVEDPKRYAKKFDSMKAKIKSEAKARLKNTVTDAEVESIANQLTPPSINDMKLPDTDPAPGSCISMRSYLAFEQIPKDNIFYKDLRTMNSYKDGDWDIEKLKDQYDRDFRIYEDTPKDKRDEAYDELMSSKARVIFLMKNPLVAQLFSAKKNSKVLKAGKAKVFGMMQKAFGLNATKADYDNYQKALLETFQTDEISDILKVDMEANLDNEVSPGNILDTTLPTSQFALERRFEDMTGESVKSCYQPDKRNKDGKPMDLDSLAACSRSFLKYCHLVSKVGVETTSKKRPSESLELAGQLDFNTDPATNMGFKNFSKEICENKRSKKGNTEVKSTFSEFKESYCKNADFNVKKECLPENNDMFVKLFISEYEPRNMSDSDKQVAAIFENTYINVMEDQPKDNKYLNTDIGKLAAKAEVHETRRAIQRLASLNNVNGQGPAAPAAMAPVADPMVAKAADVPANISGPASFADAVLAPALAPSAIKTPVKEKEEVDGIDSEKQALNEALAFTRKELARAKEKNDQDNMTEMEKRIKSLEAQLARKNEDFDKMADERVKQQAAGKKVSKSKKKSSTTGAGNDADEDQEDVKALTPSKSVSGGTTGGSYSEDRRTGRFPSSYPDANSSTLGSSTQGASGAIGGSALTGLGRLSGGGNLLNSALLAKYGIHVSGPTEGIVLAAPEKEAKELGMLADANGDDELVSLVVSSNQYDKCSVNDLKSLEDLYNKKVKQHKEAVVRISVTTSGKKEPLEFYAIRESGKVVFQPVRKHRLKHLREGMGTLNNI